MKNDPKKLPEFDINALFNPAPKESAPEPMCRILPALSQPSMVAPALKPRVVEALLKALAKKEKL